jgi:hypothetical protein
MKILTIDPGGRNCGVVILECKDGYPPCAITADLVSIAYRKDSMVVKVRQTRKVLAKYFVNVDVVVVENQNFGKRNSTIDNVIFQSVIMSMALENGAQVVVLDSRSKKNKFEKYGFVPSGGEPKKKKRKHNTSRKLGKRYARDLAAFLCSRAANDVDNVRITACEHRSDALCLAAVYLLSENKFPVLLKQEDSCQTRTTYAQGEILPLLVSSATAKSQQKPKEPLATSSR